MDGDAESLVTFPPLSSSQQEHNAFVVMQTSTH